MKRGRILPWRPHEDDYLREHYAILPCESIAFYLRRTQGGVWQRAKRLGLSKPHMGKFQPGNTLGNRFTAGNTPANKGQRTKLRIWERVVSLFDEHKELSIREMAQLLDTTAGSVAGSLWQVPDGLLHIDRWILQGRDWAAIYVAGPGKDADKPNQQAAKDHERKQRIEQAQIPHPVPRPALGLWGLVWDHNKAGAAG